MEKLSWTGRLSDHIRGNVVGYVAVFLALTGTAVALPGRNTVTSQDIVDGEVKQRDVAGAAVSVGQLDPGAFAEGDISLQGSPLAFGVTPSGIQGSEVSANTLTGSDIDESSLGEVPRATDAGSVNEVVMQPIDFFAEPGTALTTILPRTHGFRIRASCSEGGDIEVIADVDRNSRLFTWSVDSGIVDDPSLTNGIAGENVEAGQSQDLLFNEEGDQSGQTSYFTAPGPSVIVTWAADEGPTSGFTRDCVFFGHAVSH